MNVRSRILGIDERHVVPESCVRDDSHANHALLSGVSNSGPLKSCSSRAGSHGGKSRSTPPKGLMRARMARYRSVPEDPVTCDATATVRICRASSSIERPFFAACMRRRCISASSRFRIVKLATVSISRAINTSNNSLRHQPCAKIFRTSICTQGRPE